MKQSILHQTAISCLLLLLFSCGGGGSDVSGVGGTGGQTYGDNGIGGSGSPYASATPVTSTGTITGFGSIFVNGVEFFTTNAAVRIDDEKNALDDDLKLGMVVTVKGEIDANGKTGTAELVETEYEIQGVVKNISRINSLKHGDLARTFTILDNVVEIDSSGTVFHSNTAEKPPFDFATITNGDYVCMSGYTNNSGVILATHVEDLGIYGTESEVILKGVVSNYNGIDRFEIGTNTIKIKPATSLIKSDLGVDTIRDNVNVKVNGVVTASNTIDALDIEIRDIVDFTPELWIVEGIISHYDDDDETFELNATEVDFSAVDVDELKFDLDNDMHVEVTGTNVNDILVAESIKARYGYLDIDGVVTNHDLQNKVITIEVLAGQPITINYDSRTRIEDNEEDEHTTVDASTILVGDYAKIDAMDDNGSLLATIIKREKLEDDDTFKIKSYVASEASIGRVDFRITLLNNTFGTDSSTQFDPNDGSGDDTRDHFFTVVKPGDFVSIEDDRLKSQTYGDGIADEVKIRNHH